MSRSVVIKRIALSMLIGLLLGAVVSEVSFYLLNTGETRPPKLVQLDIPAGTAEHVADGAANPSIPSSMNFVVGDTLLVTNHDSVTHSLGPLLIPAGSSASMKLPTEQAYNLQCSFEPGKYMALSVLPALTVWTRIVGILEAGLNVGVLIALYAVFAMPYKKKSDKA